MARAFNQVIGHHGKEMKKKNNNPGDLMQKTLEKMEFKSGCVTIRKEKS